MNRRRFLQTTGAATVFELPALAEGADAAAHEHCRSFVRSLPAPGALSAGDGYAFAFAADGRGVADRLPAAGAYGTVVAPEARVTVALGPDERRTGDLVDRDREPDARHAGRPLFADRGRTRHRVLAPGAEATLFGVGPAKSSVTTAVTGLLDGRRGTARTYHEESTAFRRLVELLGPGASLSAEVRPEGLAPSVVAGGRRFAVRDGTASVRGVAVFESVGAATRPDATARAADAVPLPDLPADAAVVVRRTGRAVVREATCPRTDLHGGDADGRR